MLGLAFRPPGLALCFLAGNKAQGSQTTEKRIHESTGDAGSPTAHKPDHRHIFLREQPRRQHGRSASDQRHEVPPPHSITSSARAISFVGISSRRALAVVRLMMSSKRVDWITGSSAVLAPPTMPAT